MADYDFKQTENWCGVGFTVFPGTTVIEDVAPTSGMYPFYRAGDVVTRFRDPNYSQDWIDAGLAGRLYLDSRTGLLREHPDFKGAPDSKVDIEIRHMDGSIEQFTVTRKAFAVVVGEGGKAIGVKEVDSATDHCPVFMSALPDLREALQMADVASHDVQSGLPANLRGKTPQREGV